MPAPLTIALPNSTLQSMTAGGNTLIVDASTRLCPAPRGGPAGATELLVCPFATPIPVPDSTVVLQQPGVPDRTLTVVAAMPVAGNRPHVEIWLKQ
jgi:hypothetical protein